MTTVDSSTLHNNFVESSQENLQEKANSMPTQAPTEFDKSAIVQSSPEEFDAVAEAKSQSFKKTLDCMRVIVYENAHNRYFDELRVVFDKVL